MATTVYEYKRNEKTGRYEKTGRRQSVGKAPRKGGGGFEDTTVNTVDEKGTVVDKVSGGVSNKPGSLAVNRLETQRDAETRRLLNKYGYENASPQVIERLREREAAEQALGTEHVVREGNRFVGLERDRGVAEREARRVSVAANTSGIAQVPGLQTSGNQTPLYTPEEQRFLNEAEASRVREEEAQRRLEQSQGVVRSISPFNVLGYVKPGNSFVGGAELSLALGTTQRAGTETLVLLGTSPLALGSGVAVAVDKSFLFGKALVINRESALNEAFDAGKRTAPIVKNIATFRDPLTGKVTPESVVTTSLIYVSPVAKSLQVAKARAATRAAFPKSTEPEVRVISAREGGVTGDVPPEVFGKFAPRSPSLSLRQAQQGVPPELTFEKTVGETGRRVTTFQTRLARSSERTVTNVELNPNSFEVSPTKITFEGTVRSRGTIFRGDELPLVEKQLTSAEFGKVFSDPDFKLFEAGRSPEQVSLPAYANFGDPVKSGGFITESRQTVSAQPTFRGLQKVKEFPKGDFPGKQRDLNPKYLKKLEKRSSVSRFVYGEFKEKPFPTIKEQLTFGGNKRGEILGSTSVTESDTAFKNPFTTSGRPTVKQDLLNEAAEVTPLSRAKYFANPILSPKVKSESVQVQRQKPAVLQQLDVDSVTTEKFTYKSVLKPKSVADIEYKPKSRSRQAQEQILIPATDQVSKSKLDQVSVQAPKVNNPSQKRTQKTSPLSPGPNKFALPPVPKEKRTYKKVEYDVEVGKPGNKYYSNLGRGGEDLVAKAGRLVRGTAAASVRVRPVSGGSDARVKQLLGSGFKQNREGRYVQETKYRISSSGEKQQIPGASKRSKRLTRGSTYGKALALNKTVSLREARKRLLE